MKIGQILDVELVVRIQGVDYIVNAKATDIRRKRKPAKSFFEPKTGELESLISKLDFDETAVDVTQINDNFEKKVSGKTLAMNLEHLGYDEVCRFKHSDGRNHYVRYNSLLITKEDALAKIKGR
ncbi:MAG: hypothetical protein ACQKBW_07130 [Puniceicoccales bacterium]